jgi:DNA gyrase subunit A
MYDLRVFSNKPYIKIGELSVKFWKVSPHGDTSVYDAMVRMAQEWSMRYLLVDGQGNFGSVDGNVAIRYTEARMQDFGRRLWQISRKKRLIFSWVAILFMNQ